MSSQVLNMIRARVDHFLTQRCLIEAESGAVGDFGEPPHTWETVYSNEPCRLIQIGRSSDSAISEAGGAETLLDEYRLIVRRSVRLSVDQRVTVDGATFNLTRLETALTDETHHAAIVQRRL